MDETTDPTIAEWINRYQKIAQEYHEELATVGLAKNEIEYQMRLYEVREKFEAHARALYYLAVEDGIIEHGDVAPWNIHQGGTVTITLE